MPALPPQIPPNNPPCPTALLPARIFQKSICICLNTQPPLIFSMGVADKLKELEEEMGRTQKNKATEFHIGILKSKIAKLKSPAGSEKIIVTTYGARGSLIEKYSLHGLEKIKVKAAHLTKIVDPTGAGDAFRSGFIAGFIQGKSLQVCGQMGSIAAVYAIEKYGTMSHFFSQKDFTLRYQKNYQW